jgi:NitT/TauT family transport system substrate-binding protein
MGKPGFSFTEGGTRMRTLQLLRPLAGGLAAITLIVLTASTTISADVPAVRVAVTSTDGYTAYIAQDLGMFKRAGLNASIEIIGTGAAVAAAVAGHTVDIGTSNVVTLAQAHAKDLPFSMVAAGSMYLSTAPNAQFVVMPQSTVRTAKDLNGQTVAGVSIAGIFRLAMESWIDQNGGDSSQVKFVEVPPSEQFAALQRGTIAAAAMIDPGLTDVRSQIRVIGNPFDAIGKRLIVTGWFAANDWIAQNPQTLRTFARVIHDAAAWSNDPKNKLQYAAILTQYFKIPIDPNKINPYALTLDPALVQPVLDSAAKYHLIPAPQAASDLMVRP